MTGAIIGEETVSARSGLVPIVSYGTKVLRTNRAIPRGAPVYCREDFREDVARRNINITASKINSPSEVNTGFLSSLSIPNLRQGLLEHFFENSHESEDDSSDWEVCSSIYSDKSSHEDSYDLSYEESHYETFHRAAISVMTEKKKEKPYFCQNTIVYTISTFL